MLHFHMQSSECILQNTMAFLHKATGKNYKKGLAQGFTIVYRDNSTQYPLENASLHVVSLI